MEEKKFAGKNCLNGSKSSFCIVIMHGSITFICNIANLKNTTVAMSLSFLLYNMGKLPTKKNLHFIFTPNKTPSFSKAYKQTSLFVKSYH